MDWPTVTHLCLTDEIQQWLGLGGDQPNTLAAPAWHYEVNWLAATNAGIANADYLVARQLLDKASSVREPLGGGLLHLAMRPAPNALMTQPPVNDTVQVNAPGLSRLISELIPRVEHSGERWTLLNRVDVLGATPLLYALILRQPDWVQALVSAGARLPEGLPIQSQTEAWVAHEGRRMRSLMNAFRDSRCLGRPLFPELEKALNDDGAFAEAMGRLQYCVGKQLMEACGLEDEAIPMSGLRDKALRLAADSLHRNPVLPCHPLVSDEYTERIPNDISIFL